MRSPAEKQGESLSDRTNRAKARWLKRVMYESTATSTQKCLAYAIFDHLNCVTLDCWPSQQTLARCLGRKSAKTTLRAACGLATLGLITLKRSAKGRSRYRYAPVFSPGDEDKSVSGSGQRQPEPGDTDVEESSLNIQLGAEMRGRRPKPIRIKMLTGNPGKRPLNHDEPKPEAAVPECPPELGRVAKREWDRLVGELAALRMLTNLDRAALAAYCGAYALWAEAMEAIQKFGTMVKSPSGYPQQSPYVAVANRQAEIMMRIASEFGFTPASRSRISAPAKAEPNLFDLFGEPPKRPNP